MSYEIVYERQFLKVVLPNNPEPRIIPLCLHGSNNCTEYSNSGKERRSRDWSAMYFNGANQIPLETSESIMGKIESYCGGEYQEHFKRNGKYLDDAALIRFFQNGIKDAKTLSELNELSMYSIDLLCYLSVWQGNDHKIEMRRTVKTDKDLLDFILDAKIRIKNKEKEQIYVQIEFYGDKAIPHPKENRQPKVYKEECWVLASLRHGTDIYVQKLTSRRLLYCRGIVGARKFETESEALKWVDTKIKSKFVGVAETLKPTNIHI